MADVLTKTQRSYNMSRIRSENTGPEKYLYEQFKAHEINNFKQHVKEIIGTPDFYFSDHKLVIFIDGCFWHGCSDCQLLPKTNKKFWTSKIKINKERDKRVNVILKNKGIKVSRIKEHELKNANSIVLNSLYNKLMTRHPKVIDLFAGAGGLSEGFIRAGCEMVGHIEMDKNECNTLVTRMLFHALVKKGKLSEYKKYLLKKIDRNDLINKYKLQKESDSVICAKISKNNYSDLIDEIRKKLKGKELDIIIGGPPCQTYSNIARSRDPRKLKKDDRNYLYKYYIEFLKELKPKLFVFENVPGLKSAGNGKYLKDMQRLMSKAGYSTDYKVINTADFGVPQNRKRVILVGWNKKSKLRSYPNFPQVKRDYLVKDFLEDLPKIHAGEGCSIKKTVNKNKLLIGLGIQNPDFGLIIDHIARSNNKQDLEIYKLAVSSKQKGINIKYNQLPRRLKTHNNEQSFLDRFKVIDKNSFGAHTVMAHIAKDGHFYIHPDPKQNRSLTVREAARLQSFPDDYKFEGGRTSQFKQIGNAVPPMLSEIIAREVIKYLI